MLEPDLYVIVSISNAEEPPLYKLFCTWLGGYVESDEWRLNSGIVSVTKEGNTFMVYGNSGSVYLVSQNIGTTAWSHRVLQDMVDMVPDYSIVTIIQDEKEIYKILKGYIS